MTEPVVSVSVSAPAPMRILCVGDGDLTLSLALVRAYGTKYLRVTASTLLASREDLTNTYSNSEAVLSELQDRGVAIRFGIDATQLHLVFPRNSFDWICFSHPHLGLDTLRQDEAWHAERHFRLLVHYLWSADQLGDASIHVCLCGKQAETWGLMMAAAATCLELVGKHDTAAPLNSWMIPSEVDQLRVEPHYPAPRRYRNGKLGSKHFLGKFGYQHRLTHPSASNKLPNVDQSHHYVFRSGTREVGLEQPIPPSTPPPFECHVCGATYDSNNHLQLHLTAPALPNDPSCDIGPTRVRCNPKSHVNHTPNTIRKSTSNDMMATSVEWTGIVTSSGTGLRLRQFLRSTMLLSKKQSESRITSGCVSLNHTIVKDSSRMVQQNDAVEVRQLCYSEEHRVDILHREDEWVVVMKPVGMRTLGSFSQETLESTVSRQLNQTFYSLSKLDTGCAGLCVLTKHKPSSGDSPLSLKNVFTALVHGYVDAEKTTLSIHSDSSRRWRRGRRSLDEVQEEAEGVSEGYAASNAQVEDTIHVLCSERTVGESVQLSTLKITAGSDVRVDAICYALRKQGNPVVNDRFCRNEYLQLPRSVRNLIKMRLCISCFEVSVNSCEIKIPTSERFSSSYWHDHMVKSIEKQSVEPHLPSYAAGRLSDRSRHN